MRLFVYKSYFLERHIINEIQTKELNFNMKLDGNYYSYKDILYTAYHEQGPLTKKGVKVDSLVSLKDRNFLQRSWDFREFQVRRRMSLS